MNSLTRRGLLQASSAGVAILAAGGARAEPVPATMEGAAAVLPPFSLPSPAGPADGPYWRAVADLYDVTTDVVQLENGNWCMMARPVLAAYHQHLDRVNRETSFYARRTFATDAQKVVARVAALIGCDRDEITLTRNATEALLALIAGYNKLRPGDAVLYADLDYDAMQAGMEALRARRGVDVIRIILPEPASHQGLIDAYAQALIQHPKVKLLLLTHLSHRTGLVLPMADIAAMARRRGVDVIVDAAHSIGVIDFNADSLGADFVGYNMHKWMGAPVGVGVLYIRKGRVPDIDPHMGEMDAKPDDIRARVHTGTRDLAAILAVPTAIDFHQTIGTGLVRERLRYLRDRWAEALRDHPAFDILTPADPRLSAGLTSFRRRGRTSVADNAALARTLLDEHGIFTVLRSGLGSGACVRVTPGLFTQTADIDRLLVALKRIAET